MHAIPKFISFFPETIEIRFSFIHQGDSKLPIAPDSSSDPEVPYLQIEKLQENDIYGDESMHSEESSQKDKTDKNSSSIEGAFEMSSHMDY